MVKKQKRFSRSVLVIVAVGFLTTPLELASAQEMSNYSRQQIIGDRASHGITIQLPTSRATWATGTRRATANSQFVAAHQPAHAVESRIILGTNASPGATTTWQSHNANQVTSRTHNSRASGSNIRAQFRTATSRNAAFTSGGSWTP